METQELELKFIGHACVLASYQGRSVLFDPWLGSPITDGMFEGYPAFHKLTEEELDSLVGIHISHTHHDHCCVADLATLPKHVPVYIGKYLKSDFESILRNVGFENVVVVPAELRGTDVGPFRLSIFPKGPEDGSFDSSAVLTAGGKHVYLSNDCIHPDSFYFLLKHIYGVFEGAFLGYASANPFIWNSDFSDCSDIQIGFSREEYIFQRQETAWRHAARIATVLSPRWVVPYASSYRFLTRDASHLNVFFQAPTELLRFELGTAKPVFLNHGELIDTRLSTPDLSGTAQEAISIPEERIAPKRYRRAHDEAILSELASGIAPLFLEVFRRQEKQWKLPMNIHVKIVSDSLVDVVEYKYDGKSVSIDTGIEADVEMEFESGLIEDLLKGRLNLYQVYSTFSVRVSWRRVKFGQMLFSQWL